MQMGMAYYLAVDIGASSGRHILGHLEDGKIFLEEVYRFENKPVQRNGHLCWDIPNLSGHIIKGMKACKDKGKVPVSMGIDTWAVDFVLVDRDGAVLGDTVAYRDGRTQGMDVLAEEKLPFCGLYQRTGIQKQSFNTIYQLLALQKEHLEQLSRAYRFLMVPDYLHYLLTGKMENEYTNATTTALVNAAEKTWDQELLSLYKFPPHLFGNLKEPGTALGSLLPEIQKEVGFNCRVILPATHDTGSAFLAVPVEGETEVILSSGTWSLLGVENSSPIITEKGRKANFTNEGGYQYRFRYLKNIMGLWMIQSIRRELEGKYSFAQLEVMAREAGGFPSRVNVNDACFLAPESMIDSVRSFCKASKQAVPQSIGQVMECVYQSLAACYAESIRELEELTGRSFTALHIVGGGSKDGYLNELTAMAAGLPVYAGPAEGTALGNLMAQVLAAGEFDSLQAVRNTVKNSFPIREYNLKK